MRDDPAGRGVVRLLNTARGPVLCLAGAVGPAVVQAFHRRYGWEPVPVADIDTGSLTSLSAPGLELLLDHLEAASRTGRPVALRPSPDLQRLIDQAPARWS